MLLRVGVVNAPTSVGPGAWRDCWEATARRADIFGINEAQAPRAKRLYRRLAKRDGYTQSGLFKSSNPVFWDKSRYRKVAASQYRLHGRGPLWRRWPGFNSRRTATVVVLRTPGADPDVTAICTHLVPRGRKVPAWWRERARRRSREKLARIVRRHRKRDRVVVVLGDLNMSRAFALPGVEWVWDVGVDKIGIAVPAGWRMATVDAGRYRARTDHKHGVAASIRLEKVR